MSAICPVCQTELKKDPKPCRTLGFDSAYECDRCGKFILTSPAKSALSCLKDEEKIAILSHSIRKMQKKDEPVIDEQLMEAILKRPLPKPAEQKDIFIRWVGDNIKRGGDYIEVNKYSILSIIGAMKQEEFSFIFGYLKEKRLIDIKTAVGRGNVALADVTLSFDGWEYYQELKRGNIDSRKAFMAMEYGDKKLDEIVEKHFKPAVACTGFELYRLDEKPKAGLIDDRLRVEIRNSRFLIADLTHENRGAYWEAGYAEGLGKPVIYTCMKEKFDKEKSHFDTNHHLTVPWDSNNPQEAIEALKATIRATLPDEAKLTDD